jgi:hypothetical protein
MDGERPVSIGIENVAILLLSRCTRDCLMGADRGRKGEPDRCIAF